MSAAEELLGLELHGSTHGRTWRVVEKTKSKSEHSPGSFSIGYKVIDNLGAEGFLKVTDWDIRTEDTASNFDKAVATMMAHKFELDILDYCNGNNMDRVVVAIDHGETMVVYEGVRQPIFYLIFELARCDVRVQVDTTERFDLAWCLGALHDVSVAVKQLHSGSVTHNDIKPANILVFDAALQKLADLGCATSPLFSAIHDSSNCLGDEKYAAPEYLYALSQSRKASSISFLGRRASDLYQLGSVLFYLVTGQMLTPAVLSRMLPAHLPACGGTGFQGSFDEVLPYWREAFSAVVEQFTDALPKDRAGLPTVTAQQLRATLVELCEPDPELRGHPLDKARSRDSKSVERYITLFDRLRSIERAAA